MTHHVERINLEDVLDAYVSEVQTPSHAALVEWIRRYPQFAQELTDFTVAWIRMETLPPASSAKSLTD